MKVQARFSLSVTVESGPNLDARIRSARDRKITALRKKKWNPDWKTNFPSFKEILDVKEKYFLNTEGARCFLARCKKVGANAIISDCGECYNFKSTESLMRRLTSPSFVTDFLDGGGFVTVVVDGKVKRARVGVVVE